MKVEFSERAVERIKDLKMGGMTYTTYHKELSYQLLGKIKVGIYTPGEAKLVLDGSLRIFQEE